MKDLLRAILLTIFCGLFAFIGVWIVKPDQKWVIVIWAIFFSVSMLGCEGWIVYQFYRAKRIKEILDGKRPIDP